MESATESATGAAQNGAGFMTGNTTDQNNSQLKRNEADVEHDAFHSTVKSPGTTVAGSGTVTKVGPDPFAREDRSSGEGHSVGQDHSAGRGHSASPGRVAGQDRSPGEDHSVGQDHSTGQDRSAGQDRSSGRWNQTIGSAKEAIGGLTSSENLKQAGREQNLRGQRQEAEGQISDLGNGIADRMAGALGGAAAGLTGDREKQMKYQDLQDKGKAKQRGTAQDIKNQAAARQQATAQ